MGCTRGDFECDRVVDGMGFDHAGWIAVSGSELERYGGYLVRDNGGEDRSAGPVSLANSSAERGAEARYAGRAAFIHATDAPTEAERHRRETETLLVAGLLAIHRERLCLVAQRGRTQPSWRRSQIASERFAHLGIAPAGDRSERPQSGLRDQAEALSIDGARTADVVDIHPLLQRQSRCASVSGGSGRRAGPVDVAPPAPTAALAGSAVHERGSALTVGWRLADGIARDRLALGEIDKALLSQRGRRRRLRGRARHGARPPGRQPTPTAPTRTRTGYNRMLWTALRRKAAYLPG